MKNAIQGNAQQAYRQYARNAALYFCFSIIIFLYLLIYRPEGWQVTMVVTALVGMLALFKWRSFKKLSALPDRAKDID